METTKTQEALMFSIDTNTRAGRMIEAGRVTVTFTSPKTGEHITLVAKARGTDERGKWIATSLADAKVVFIEVQNADGGWNDKVGKVTASRGFVADPSADPARVFCAKQLLRFVNGEDMGSLVAQEAERCGKCGRELTDPVSIDRGIGPECYGRITGSKHQTKVKAEAPVSAPSVKAYESNLEAAAEMAAAAADGNIYLDETPIEEMTRIASTVTAPTPKMTWREEKAAVAEQQGRKDAAAEAKKPCSQMTTLPGTTWEDMFRTAPIAVKNNLEF